MSTSITAVMSSLSRRLPRRTHVIGKRTAAGAQLPFVTDVRSQSRPISPATSSRSVPPIQPAGRRYLSSTPSRSDQSSSEPPELVPSTLSQAEYERISEEDMETLHENLGALCEESGRESWEVDYSSGVLTLSIPPHGTYVLNKQPPNQQIWISSPVSGPSRFGYVADSSQSLAIPLGNQTNTPGMVSTGADGEGLRGAWTHFRRPGVTLGGLVEGELRALGVGKDEGEEWLGVGIK